MISYHKHTRGVGNRTWWCVFVPINMTKSKNGLRNYNTTIFLFSLFYCFVSNVRSTCNVKNAYKMPALALVQRWPSTSYFHVWEALWHYEHIIRQRSLSKPCVSDRLPGASSILFKTEEAVWAYLFELLHRGRWTTPPCNIESSQTAWK